MDKLAESLEDHKFFGIIFSKLHTLNDDFKTAYIEKLLAILNKPPIDITLVKSIIGMDVLEEQPSLRSLCWKLLLNYIPTDNTDWETHIDQKRAEYNELKQKYLVSITKKKKKAIDHPLSNNSDWEGYFKDNQIMKDIEKDLKRTRNELPFFTNKSRANKKETNLDVLKRILLIFAKKYPDICYVQGLNEILATIYYCFSLDENPYFFLELEADSFFCFEHLVTKTKDIYIQSNDSGPTGIKTRLNYVKYLLHLLDYEMTCHFKNNSIEISTIAFRWFTIYFAQEFSITGAMKIYDYILIQEDLYYTLTLLCLSALKIKREALMSKDLGEVMTALQIFDDKDIAEMITKNHELDSDLRLVQEKLDYNAFINSSYNHE